MSDEREGFRSRDNTEQETTNANQQSAIDELDVRPEDVAKVKGGRMTDPCEGGE
jgi:hypothetical protein